MALRNLPARVRTLATMGNRRRMLLAEAAACLVIARTSLLLFPFRRVAKGIGSLVPPADPRVAAAMAPTTPDAAATAREIGWAVRAAARRVPTKAVCLQQAMAAHAMLRRRGIASAMHFGAGRGESKPLEAHAWLDAAGVHVTGYPLPPNTPPIGAFV